MIAFSKQTLWQRVRYALDRDYRKAIDERRREGLRWLVEHPEAPCMIGGIVVPDGYGNNCLRAEYNERSGLITNSEPPDFW